MIGRKLLPNILLVSSAHALVHIYELSLPSVEQQISGEYFPENPAEGKLVMGWLAYAWRLPWGVGALVAGWMIDRSSSRKMLAIYLLGCAAACGFVAVSTSLPMVFGSMILMGSFAAIYHPAGLTLISHETTLENRTKAHGIHGIFGSAGIAGAPLLAALLLGHLPTWQDYYWVLAAPGLLLGVIFVGVTIRAGHEHEHHLKHSTATGQQADWRSFFALTSLALAMGCIYSGVMSFLPRYMGNSGFEIHGVTPQESKNYLTALALLIGCLGQYLAAAIARARLLERQLAAICFLAAPVLAWMAVAEGFQRVISASLFSLIFFMHQPIYNSLIAKYTPARRRSLCYGFSFAMGLGLGSIGAVLAGASSSDELTFGLLAGMGIVAGGLGLVLCRRNPIV